MFRVCKAEEPSRTIITIDGNLSGDYVGAVELCCVQAMSEGKPVHLLLRDVPTVDQSGRALLSRMAAKGIHLLASGVYASYLVRRAGQAGAEPLTNGAINGQRSQ
jgi:hypothetical protein